jgi:FAD synthase
MFDDQPICSTRIREALYTGNIELANTCLGRPFRMSWTSIPDNPPFFHANEGVRVDIPPEHAAPRDGCYQARVQHGMADYETVVEFLTKYSQVNGALEPLVRKIALFSIPSTHNIESSLSLDILAPERA